MWGVAILIPKLRMLFCRVPWHDITRSPWSTRPPHRCWFAVRSHGSLWAMVFLEAEAFRLVPLSRDNWDPHSAQPGDLPPGINTSCVPRAVNTHALGLPLRHNAPRLKVSFFVDMFHAILLSNNNRQSTFNHRQRCWKRSVLIVDCWKSPASAGTCCLKSTMAWNRGQRNYQLTPFDDFHEVQEYWPVVHRLRLSAWP